MSKKVLTAPLARIEVNGVPIGKMRNIRVTENMRRGRVSGIGQLTPQELPALEWNGQLNCGFFAIDLKNKSRIPNALIRTATAKQFVDTVLLQEEGVDIVILKKTKSGEPDPNTGLIESSYETFARVSGAFVDSESFDINEGQISGNDQSFTYISPILFTP